MPQHLLSAMVRLPILICIANEYVKSSNAHTTHAPAAPFTVLVRLVLVLQQRLQPQPDGMHRALQADELTQKTSSRTKPGKTPQPQIG